MFPIGKRMAILGNKIPYYQKVRSVRTANLIGYWRGTEASGTAIVDVSGQGNNGTYTGVALGNPGIGDGLSCPRFDGVGDYGTLFSAGLAAGFNGQEGTLTCWVRNENFNVTGVQRVCTFAADANNIVRIYKNSTAKTIAFQHYVNPASVFIQQINYNPAGWAHLALTWSRSANQVKAFIDGAQIGTTQAGIGLWAGALATAYWGADTNTPTLCWNGWLCHLALWNAVLTPTEIAKVAGFTPSSGYSVSGLGQIQVMGNYEGTNPIISLGTGGDSDIKIREIGNVLYEPADAGREYKTWYTGYNAGVTTDEKIHHAYSSDGLTWTKSASNPVINARRAEDPYVVKSGATYYLFAEDKTDATPSNKIRRWSSADGETWADDGQLTGVTNWASPVVWIEGGTWYMIYENYPAAPIDIRLATSANGLAWTAEASNPVMAVADNNWSATEIVPDDIVKIGGVYYLFYHGYSGGIWKTGIATSANLTAWTDHYSNPLPDDAKTAIPTTMIYYDTRYVLHFYYDTDASGILRGYPLRFN